MNNKKRILIFGIPLVLIFLAGGYLLLDKFYFHRIFKIKPGSCLILEQKYCKKGVVVPNSGDPNEIEIAFNLPAGTKVFSPINGQVITPMIGLEKGLTKNTSSGFIVESEADNTTSKYSLLMNLDQNSRFTDSKPVKKGDFLGNLNNNQISFIGKYNLIFKLNKSDNNGQMISTKEIVKQLFSIKK